MRGRTGIVGHVHVGLGDTDLDVRSQSHTVVERDVRADLRGLRENDVRTNLRVVERWRKGLAIGVDLGPEGDAPPRRVVRRG